jgi:Fe-S-cluster containining protein
MAGTPTTTLPAGELSSWLRSMEGALRSGGGSDVPCDGCTACCRSSQFVPIEPDELDTLTHVPAELQFPAPGRPRGHVVLGYDEQGHCPMLIDDRCSIYPHRPRACRTYDCRIFPAAGVTPDKPLVADRVTRWEFSYRDDGARAEHEAVRAAARFVQDHPDVLPGAAGVPSTQRAVLAVELHDLFLDADHPPAPSEVRVRLGRRRDG